MVHLTSATSWTLHFIRSVLSHVYISWLVFLEVSDRWLVALAFPLVLGIPTISHVYGSSTIRFKP